MSDFVCALVAAFFMWPCGRSFGYLNQGPMLSLFLLHAAAAFRCGGFRLVLCLGTWSCLLGHVTSPAPVYTLMYNIQTTQMVEDFLGYLLVSNERKVVMRLAFWDRTCAPRSSWSYNFLEQNKRNDGSFFAFSELVPVTCNSNFYMYQPAPWSFKSCPRQHPRFFIPTQMRTLWKAA